MKATFTLNDVIVTIPADYLDQQTCLDSIFTKVPAEKVDIEALIKANKANRDIRWYRQGCDNEFVHITLPTDLIKWED